MLLFLAAISSLTFQNTNNYIRAGLGVVWGIIVSLIVWCITASWEEHDEETNFLYAIVRSVKTWRIWSARPFRLASGAQGRLFGQNGRRQFIAYEASRDAGRVV